MIEINCKQGTPEWYAARRGIPTASNFDKILTAKTCKLSASITEYAYQLIAERTIGTPIDVESYTSRDMQYGIETEAEARRAYAFHRDCTVRQVGFVLHESEKFGCSPDGLVDPDGGLELKCPKLTTHLRYLDEGVLPDEYKQQVHGCLLVTGRKWWDFMSYATDAPPFIVRVTPDDYTDTLKLAMIDFEKKYRHVVERITALGWLEKHLSVPTAEISIDTDDTIPFVSLTKAPNIGA